MQQRSEDELFFGGLAGIAEPMGGYTREAAIRPNKHYLTGNDRMACSYAGCPGPVGCLYQGIRQRSRRLDSFASSEDWTRLELDDGPPGWARCRGAGRSPAENLLEATLQAALTPGSF